MELPHKVTCAVLDGTRPHLTGLPDLGFRGKSTSPLAGIFNFTNSAPLRRAGPRDCSRSRPLPSHSHAVRLTEIHSDWLQTYDTFCSRPSSTIPLHATPFTSGRSSRRRNTLGLFPGHKLDLSFLSCISSLNQFVSPSSRP